jgi:hypothetical protein
MLRRNDNAGYAKYLRSAQWKAKCKAVRERCSNVCERCRKYLVDEVHHLTYDHVYNEPLQDLQGLCGACHSFLHDKSGTDPVVTSIMVKVTNRQIEYWDSEARKFRKVRIDTLPAENFHWLHAFVNGVYQRSLSQHECGKYDVPTSVFLSTDGTPLFKPSIWERYRVAYRVRGEWYGSSRSPQRLATEPDREQLVKDCQARTKAETERRLGEFPMSFTSFKGKAPTDPKAVIALFRKHARIIAYGFEGDIQNVRLTKRYGVAFDYQTDEVNGSVWRCRVYHADWKLNEGTIILDHERGVWIEMGRKRSH